MCRFALDLTLCRDTGEESNPAEPDVVDPFSSLGEGGEKRLAGLGFNRRFCAGRMTMTFTAAKLGAVQGSVIVVVGESQGAGSSTGSLA